ncbi:MAG: hypothetical protein EZS28_021341 [Streblomastix strix]|uniref:Uncharacterized protein n=1 Tax=Streblomastix strix TaxID=222440 RepID=A0A5J4VLB0_9EUKA|nr:MAG: hypothetical protein EZS28_021341 [Streblomastix strix]
MKIIQIGTHLSQENDQQTLALRSISRRCLWSIQLWGDESAHSELVNVGYTRVLVIAISTASGSGEEKAEEISLILFRISQFFNNLNKGRNLFPPQPLLAHRSYEQLEEEGGNEEIDSQLINKGHQYCNIKDSANEAKQMIMNYFINRGTS